MQACEQKKVSDLQNYAKAFKAALAESFGEPLDGFRFGGTEYSPTHVASAFGPKDGQFTIATMGFGTWRQPNWCRDGAPERLELIGYTDQQDEQMLEVLSGLGKLLFLSGSDESPWKPFDTVALPEPMHGLRYFVFAPGGELEVDATTKVHLLIAIPLTESEFPNVRGGKARAWLESQLGSPETVQANLRRWRPTVNAQK